MGWFKSAEEKAAEKRKKELVEKYGEKDGLRIYENKISEEKYLEEKEKEKKKAAQQKKKAAKQKVLDYVNSSDLDGSILMDEIFFEKNPDKDDYKFCLSVKKDKEYGMRYEKFVQLTKELIEEGKLFTVDTWKGEALPDWMMEKDTGVFPHISVFTKSYAEDLIAYENERQKKEAKRKNSIIDLLTKKSIKMTISDITAHINDGNRHYIKGLLEEMHKDGDIDFAGSGRYFIYSEKKKEPKPKKTSAPKSVEVDVEKELEKLKGLLDKGLITQEQYDAKSNELLGL